MRRDIDCLSPQFKEKVELFMKEVGDKIFITCSGRTEEEQKELYARGRTKPGQIVTRTLNSKHLIKGEGAQAIDIAFYGSELYPKNHNTRVKIAKIANKYGIDRSYDLFKKEKAHFQDNGKSLIIKIKVDYLYKRIINVLIKYNSNYYDKSNSEYEKNLLHDVNNLLRKLKDFYE